MNKQTVVYPNNGIIFSTENNELSSHEKKWKKLKFIWASQVVQW